MYSKSMPNISALKSHWTQNFRSYSKPKTSAIKIQPNSVHKQQTFFSRLSRLFSFSFFVISLSFVHFKRQPASLRFREGRSRAGAQLSGGGPRVFFHFGGSLQLLMIFKGASFSPYRHSRLSFSSKTVTSKYFLDRPAYGFSQKTGDGKHHKSRKAHGQERAQNSSSSCVQPLGG